MLSPYIKKLDFTDSYKIRILFETGETRLFDAAPFLEGEIFEPLKDKAFFNKASVSYNTIEWPNGADFAPEFLWEHSIPIK